MEHPRSWYAATALPQPRHVPLAGSTSCDVCVVGGGYTGLSAALHLRERGYDVVLLEQARIGWGASGRNGGQVVSGQRQDQQSLERRYGHARAQVLWALAQEAKALVRSRIARHDIACDPRPGILHVGHKPRHARAEQRYAQWLREHYDYEPIRAVTRDELATMLASPVYYGGSLDLGALHLHPLNYAHGLAAAAAAAGVRLHEHTRVDAVSGSAPVTVRTAVGELRAGAVVYACNGYLGALLPEVAGRIMPINNFIVATEPLGEARARALIRDDVAVSDTRFVVNYFRLSADRRLLFGGGESYSSRLPADIAAYVRPHLRRVFPQLGDVRIDFAWGGTLAITRTRLPHFDRIDGNRYVAHGFSGQGVALGTLAGKLIAEAIAGDQERFDVFARVRPPFFPGGRWLRQPLLVLGMFYYAMRDRL
ncbi:MAG: FAD-binding oxidoreductase [Gammaproteobacteria bacterium]|nr:FAD-binding oxidoreductase [Gammaproteobacteria bacterium]